MKLKILVGISGALFAVAVGAGSALAYTVGAGSTATGPSSIAAGTPFTFLATFVQPDGTPIPAGQTVTFSQLSGPGTAMRVASAPVPATGSGNAACVNFNPATAVTNASGQASTSVTINCTGQFTLAAGLQGGGAVTLVVTVGTAFPNTSAPPVPSPVPGLAAILVGALLVAAAVIGLTRRSPRSPAEA